VPRTKLLGGPDWRGVRSTDADAYLEAIANGAEFRTRHEAEEDASWKQVIPYLLLRDGERLFLMRRTRGGGDERLHERYSIGVGGHINPEDGDVLGGLRREWHEEIDAAFEPSFTLVGLLNDDEDPVGAVHFGVVYATDAAGHDVAVRETDKLSGRFATREEVRRVYDGLETWSQLLFTFLEGEAGAAEVSAAR
jgi:predicted NUDIX family phosphoesterase